MQTALGFTLPKAAIQGEIASGSTRAVGRHYPLELRHWNIYEQIADFDFLESFPDAHWQEAQSINLLPDYLMNSDCEQDTQGLVLRHVGEHLGKVFKRHIIRIPTAMVPSSTTSPFRRTLFRVYCDLVAADEGGSFMPLEVKPAGGEVENQLTLDAEQDESYEQLYKDFIDHPENSRFEVAARAIAQCVGYMRDMNAKYGVITSYNKWWFLHEDQQDIVSVSDAVECTSSEPTILQAVMYIAHQAGTDLSAPYPTVKKEERRLTGDVRKPEHVLEPDDIIFTQESEANANLYASTVTVSQRRMGLRSQSAPPAATSSAETNPQTESAEQEGSSGSSSETCPGASAVGSVPSSESEESGSGPAPQATGAASQHGTSAGSATTATGGAKHARDSDSAKELPASKRSRAGGSQIDEYALLADAEEGPRWDDLLIGGMLGKGASADVHQCTTRTDATPRAIKLYCLEAEKSRLELSQERNAYRLLLACQGELVARVYNTSVVSPSGSIGGIVMELGNPMPPTFAQWNYHDKQQAMRLLTRLSKEYHVIQYDMRPQNFIKDAAGHILVVDLAQARQVSDARTRRNALREIINSI